MEQLLEILSEIQPDVDYETCTTLIDDEWLDSFAILSIVSELEEAFDIGITPADIVPENFNSAHPSPKPPARLSHSGSPERGMGPVHCRGVPPGPPGDPLCHGKDRDAI